jgi:hypothetical protein
MSRFFFFRRMTRVCSSIYYIYINYFYIYLSQLVPMVLAGTPLIDNKPNVIKPAEASSGTPPTGPNKVFGTFTSIVHYLVRITCEVAVSHFILSKSG